MHFGATAVRYRPAGPRDLRGPVQQGATVVRYARAGPSRTAVQQGATAVRYGLGPSGLVGPSGLPDAAARAPCHVVTRGPFFATGSRAWAGAAPSRPGRLATCAPVQRGATVVRYGPEGPCRHAGPEGPDPLPGERDALATRGALLCTETPSRPQRRPPLRAAPCSAPRRPALHRGALLCGRRPERREAPSRARGAL